MISRRHLLFSAVTSMLFPGSIIAGLGAQKKLGWTEFRSKMTELANANGLGNVDNNYVVKNGMKILNQLDISAIEFKQAVDDSYETGNRYWLWQRLIKDNYLNGGILNISSDQIVQLHDHPGATGMLRILSGEVEMWLFDEVKNNQAEQDSVEQSVIELTRITHRVLRAGDMAVLTPDKGNIHALRALNKTCSMLDFFIPPYKTNQRSWFEPLADNWFDMERISCYKIPQHAYMQA